MRVGLIGPGGEAVARFRESLSHSFSLASGRSCFRAAAEMAGIRTKATVMVTNVAATVAAAAIDRGRVASKLCRQKKYRHRHNTHSHPFYLFASCALQDFCSLVLLSSIGR